MSGMLIFSLVVLLTLPLTAFYLVVYELIMLLGLRRKGISGTAYEPFTIRLLMHDLGLRDDPYAARLARGLPATGPRLWPLFSGPLRLAVGLSGYVPVVFRMPVARPPSLLALMTLRTEFFDRSLREALATAEQLVILGAGWDTRAYGLPADRALRIFEVDAPATQAVKRAALAKAGIDCSRVTFVALDFNRQSWLEALRARGFDADRPTFVLWEGVSMYLEPQAVSDTLACVAGMAEGSAIAFDYLAEALVRHAPPFRLLGPCFTLGIRLGYGEQLVFGLPMQPQARAEAARFVEARGLTLAELVLLPERGPIKAPLYGFALAAVRRDRAARAST